MKRSTTVMKGLFAKSLDASPAGEAVSAPSSASPITPVFSIGSAQASSVGSSQASSPVVVPSYAASSASLVSDQKAASFPDFSLSRNAWYSRDPEMMFDFEEGIEHEARKDAAAKAGLARASRK